MRLSTRFSDAVHLLSFIEIFKGQILTSPMIAASINTSPVVVRRLLATLRDGGLVTTTSRQPALAKPASEITMLDVYLLTESNTPLFAVDKDTNPYCSVGGNIQGVLTDIYSAAETAAFASLDKTSLQDVVDQLRVAQKLKNAQ